MNSPAKLTDTQFAILSEASQRKDRCLIPPKTLKVAAAQKVGTKLLKASLAREIKAKGGMEAWRRDRGNGPSVSIAIFSHAALLQKSMAAFARAATIWPYGSSASSNLNTKWTVVRQV